MIQGQSNPPTIGILSKFAIISMQQQIYIEREEQKPIKIDQIHNSQPVRPQDELISEHYEQDFDSISDITPVADSQIFQEVSQCIENLPLSYTQIPHVFQEHLENCTVKIQEECLQLKAQIQALQAQLVQTNEVLDDTQRNQEEIDIYDHLLEEKNKNKILLASQQQQLNNVLVSLLGNESLSIELIQAEIESNQDLMIQERLLEEGVRLNALLHCTANQIAKLKREVDKNGYLLSVMDEVKKEMIDKHHSLYREIEQKKQKQTKNQAKLGQLGLKIEQLGYKITKFQGKVSSTESNQAQLRQQWQFYLGQKERLAKRIKISNHAFQQSVASLRRTILDLKKHQRQLIQSQSELTQRNVRIEEENSKKMERFHKLTNHSGRQRSRTKVNHFITNEQSLNLSKQFICQPNDSFLDRKYKIPVKIRRIPNKNLSSQIIGSDLQEVQNKFHHLSIGAQHAEQDVINEIETKLKECSTDGTLRKQFKLKLPNKNLKSSEKYLDLSQTNVIKPVLYTKLSEKFPSNGKLSITERLQRIQLLQKEDRRHSMKLQGEKQKKVERQNTKNIKDVFIVNDNPCEKKENEMRSSSYSKNNQLPVQPQIRLSHSVSSTQKNIFTSPLKAKVRLQTHIDSKLPSLSGIGQHNSTKYNSVTSETNAFIFSDGKKINAKQQIPSLDKELNLQNLLNTKILFSSIQQKLSMRQSSACETFNLAKNNGGKQQTAIDNTSVLDNSVLSLNVSRIGRQSSIVRRRGEKKISDQYMKILEQRGRRILELENQGD